MNHDRAQSILLNQTSLARKVFAAVPKQEFWSIGQISNEMHRVEKHNLTKAEISGCLSCLIDAGLVTEGGILTFRSNVKPQKPTRPVRPTMSEPTKSTSAAKPSLMERCFLVAGTLRRAAENLETLGLEIDSAITEAGQGNEKLKQLQSTLRGLMGETP